MQRESQRLIVTIFGMAAVAMSLLQPILPLYLTSIDIPPEFIGLMISVSMIAMAIGEGYWGWVADKVGVRIPLYVGTFVCGITVLFFVLAESVMVLFVVFFFWGLFRSAIFGPSRGVLAAGSPLGKKATRLAIVTAILAAANSLGALPSGFIADAWGYSSVFFFSAGISLGGALIVLFGIKGIKPVKEELKSAEGFFVNNKLWPLTLQCSVTVFQYLGLGILIAFLPLLVTQVMKASAAEVGILISARGIASMLFSVPMGVLADRLGNQKMMFFGLFITAVSMIGFSLANSFAWFVVIIIFHSIGYSSFSPAALSMFSSTAPLNRQGTTMGFYGAICENSGLIAGSALGGFVWSAWGGEVTFLLGAAASFIGAIVFYFFLSFQRKNSNLSK